MMGTSRNIIYEDDKLVERTPTMLWVIWTCSCGPRGLGPNTRLAVRGRLGWTASSVCPSDCRQIWGFTFLSLDFAIAPLCRSKIGQGLSGAQNGDDCTRSLPKVLRNVYFKTSGVGPLLEYPPPIYINQKPGSLVVVNKPQPVTQRTSTPQGRGSAAGYGRTARTACAGGLAGPAVAVARDEVCPSQHGRISRKYPRADNGQNKQTSLKYAS